MCCVNVLEFTVGSFGVSMCECQPNNVCVCVDVRCLLELTVGPAVSEGGCSAA